MSAVVATLTSPKEVLTYAREHGLKIVDYKFVDLPGTWQHFSSPISELTEDIFSEGVGFDGSSVRGFQQIHESDMLLMPDPSTAIVDPVCSVPTLSIVCDVADPVTHEPYSRDPRYIGRKAEAYLKKTGIADTSFWGPEAEFFIFDSVRYEQNQHSAFYAIDSDEGIWNSGKEGQGHKPRWKEGYFPVAPADSLQDFRSEVILKLIEAGVDVEVHHHEVATAGQCEIDMRFNSLLKMGDNLLMYKYVIKNMAKAVGKTATFMPKPIWGDNGSGMHVHQSLWKAVDGRQGRLRRLEPARQVLHRRPVEARARPAGDHVTDGELVSPARAWLRGTRQFSILAPQSFGRGAHPDVFGKSQGQAY
jgi:glutamine synthetase